MNEKSKEEFSLSTINDIVTVSLNILKYMTTSGYDQKQIQKINYLITS